MQYHNCECDKCGQVKPECLGLGTYVDVMNICLECLGVQSVEEYYARLDKLEDEAYDDCAGIE